MAILAVAPGPDGVEQTLGVARVVADPDNIEAELGIIVRSQLKGGGLGELLMHKLIRTMRDDTPAISLELQPASGGTGAAWP